MALTPEERAGLPGGPGGPGGPGTLTASNENKRWFNDMTYERLW